jgi:hypothetical protein
MVHGKIIVEGLTDKVWDWSVLDIIRVIFQHSAGETEENQKERSPSQAGKLVDLVPVNRIHARKVVVYLLTYISLYICQEAYGNTFLQRYFMCMCSVYRRMRARVNSCSYTEPNLFLSRDVV